jgi:hypothetical protein
MVNWWWLVLAARPSVLYRKEFNPKKKWRKKKACQKKLDRLQSARRSGPPFDQYKIPDGLSPPKATQVNLGDSELL